jgi:hypothetical protein
MSDDDRVKARWGAEPGNEWDWRGVTAGLAAWLFAVALLAGVARWLLM